MPTSNGQPASADDVILAAKPMSRSRTIITAAGTVLVFALNQLVGNEIISFELAQDILLTVGTVATVVFRIDADAPLRIPGLRRN